VNFVPCGRALHCGRPLTPRVEHNLHFKRKPLTEEPEAKGLFFFISPLGTSSCY
jgi:hypothetical protein